MLKLRLSKEEKKDRETRAFRALEEVWHDPEWLKLKAERDAKIKAIEDAYKVEYKKIRDRIWAKYGL